MVTADQEQHVVDSVREKLRNAAREGKPPLKVQGSKREDDWIYVTVAPSEKGGRASDHADLMADIEKEVRDEGVQHVLLVPTVPE